MSSYDAWLTHDPRFDGLVEQSENCRCQCHTDPTYLEDGACPENCIASDDTSAEAEEIRRDPPAAGLCEDGIRDTSYYKQDRRDPDDDSRGGDGEDD